MAVKKLTKPTNKLKDALEKGKSVKGIVGWVATGLKASEAGENPWPVIIKAKCVRVEAGNKDLCKVRIFATPMSGKGEFEIDVCNWYDSTATFKKQYEYDQRIGLANIKAKMILGSEYVTETRRRVEAFLKEVSPSDQKLFISECIELNGLNEDSPIKSVIRKTSRSQVKTLLPEMISKMFKVKTEDLESLRYH